LAVHLYGHPANLSALQAELSERNIPIVEDCAQAQGATVDGRQVGGLATVGCFSFYPTKNLGALGDGGAVVTNNSILADRVRKLRTYGWERPQFCVLDKGKCSRLDELQAALLSLKLPFLDRNIERRRYIAARYSEAFRNLPIAVPVERVGARHAYHLYVVRSEERDALEAYLAKAGIGTARHYPSPVHQQPGFAKVSRIGSSLSVTERIAGEILSLPIFPTMSEMQIERVIGAVTSFFDK